MALLAIGCGNRDISVGPMSAAPTNTPGPGITFTATLGNNLSPTPTLTASPTPTWTFTNSPTGTQSPSNTPTFTPTSSNTPTASPTPTSTSTSTGTPICTFQATSTPILAVENNDTSGAANNLGTLDAVDIVVRGSVDAAGDMYDWFQFTAANTGTAYLYVDCFDDGSGTNRLRVVAFDQGLVYLAPTSSDGTPSVQSASFPVTASQSYYLRVDGLQGRGNYRFVLSGVLPSTATPTPTNTDTPTPTNTDSFTPTPTATFTAITPVCTFQPTSTPVLEVENNDTSGAANDLGSLNAGDTVFKGSVDASNDPYDWFKVTMANSGMATISLDCFDNGGGVNQFRIVVYDQGMNFVTFTSPGGMPEEQSQVFPVSSGQLYYLRVDALAGTGNYRGILSGP